MDKSHYPSNIPSAHRWFIAATDTAHCADRDTIPKEPMRNMDEHEQGSSVFGWLIRLSRLPLWHVHSPKHN